MKHQHLLASLWPLLAACAAASGDSLSPPSERSTTVNSATMHHPDPPPPRYDGPPSDDPSPEPAACSGGPTPTVFLRSLASSLTGFALSATHVYWSDAIFGIYRQPKAGGDNERVAEEHSSGNRVLSIVGSQLYWSRYPTLYRMPLEGGTEPVLLAGDVTGAWSVRGSTLYYMSDPSGTIVGAAAGIGELRSVPISGGASRLIAADQWSSSALAADTTGIYWYPDLSRSEPRGHAHVVVTSSALQKYSFASNSVLEYATMAPGVHLVQTVGERVIASDSVSVWSSTT